MLDGVPDLVADAVMVRASESPSFADPLHYELLEHMRAAISKLKDNAYVDPLTRLPNRAAIEEQLAVELERAQLVGRPLALLLADIDNFKTVNDQLGHLAGDGVLRAVGSRLRTAMRHGDAVGRWGGDEFVVVCPGASEPDVERIAAHVQEAVSSQPVMLARKSLAVCVSIGGAVSAVGGAEELIAAADAAMYRAKKGIRVRSR